MSSLTPWSVAAPVDMGPRRLTSRCIESRWQPTPPIILVVDDFPMVLEVYVEALARAGYDVDGVGEGRTAIQVLRTRRYDVIVCDYRMEGVTGLDVLEAARRHARGTPVILLSAMATDAVVAQAYARGAFGVLAKPLSIPDLLRVVSEALDAVRGVA
jgi:CheY-like chemotaxis protein